MTKEKFFIATFVILTIIVFLILSFLFSLSYRNPKTFTTDEVSMIYIFGIIIIIIIIGMLIWCGYILFFRSSEYDYPCRYKNFTPMTTQEHINNNH